jgi:hypothetical protein
MFPWAHRVTAHGVKEAAQLRHGGADLVLVPYADAAVRAAERLLAWGDEASAARG